MSVDMFDGVDIDAATEEAKEAVIPYVSPEEQQAEDELQSFQNEVWHDVHPYAHQVDEDRWELERQGVEALVKRLALVDRQQAEAVAFIDAEIAAVCDQLDALRCRRDEIEKPFQRRREWLQGYLPELKAWAAQQLQNAKARSIKLAYGTLRFRKAPDSITFTGETGEEQAVEWAQENGYQDVLVIHASKTAIKRRIQETGEVVPGVEYVVGEDKFTVETEGR